MIVWQNGQRAWTRGVEHPNQSQSNPVTNLMSHPVQSNSPLGGVIPAALCARLHVEVVLSHLLGRVQLLRVEVVLQVGLRPRPVHLHVVKGQLVQIPTVADVD